MFEVCGGDIYQAIGHDALQRSDFVGVIQPDGEITWLKSRIIGMWKVSIAELIEFVSQK